MAHRMIAPALALAALATSQTAVAQAQVCVSSADLSDAVVYAMPIAYDATRTACANRLSATGFMVTGGDAYIGQFRAGQNQAWPGAFRVLKTFMASDSAAESGAPMEMDAMLSAMPEESLRPFVDALVGQMIAEEIKGDTCDKIERGLELISPLPTGNVGGLVAFIAEMTELKSPPICGAAAPGGTARK
ncbi:MAG: hypothetical protein GW858_03455 [Sphingomonadales bacterium]|nr:hypothetical protein [Sphingomonadales bacterium]NCQ20906.1 hypothetical protein [Sphingomonadales bacterium]NCT02663.1 hypothetical protein [Sphingomonadales bacterium]